MSEHGLKCFDNKCAAVGDYCHLQCPDGTDIDCRMLVRAEWKQRAERAEAERERDEAREAECKAIVAWLRGLAWHFMEGIESAKRAGLDGAVLAQRVTANTYMIAANAIEAGEHHRSNT